ncbi:hypothetical protein BDV30DRAFT_209221 [Aspergillus minisclerotigenes]|uniref:Uncharacterized protein n=1 Tax=Aspergillus minisclerotigenes TaxID=656917 RepID=A0A5N6J8K6_9EURO|nr:hypothetical protein BDV30DRAFT_209221 [Aspergillus minisclerotigenes]
MMPLLAFCIYFSEIKSSVAGAELQEEAFHSYAHGRETCELRLTKSRGTLSPLDRRGHEASQFVLSSRRGSILVMQLYGRLKDSA